MSSAVTRPLRVRKAVAYIVRGDRLRVFRHRDVDVAVSGIQVPAGTIRESEDPAEAALRGAAEETGLIAASDSRPGKGGLGRAAGATGDTRAPLLPARHR